MSPRALVLGAGGNAAIAWEIGLITGMDDGGIDLRAADVFVGTSAGSTVAAQITSGLSLEELFQRQIDPRLQVYEPQPPVDFNRWRADLLRAKEDAGNATAFLRKIGSLNVTVPSTPECDRRLMIGKRLPVHAWPQQRVLLVAVDAESGERHVFDRTGNVGLVDAVAASCAVAGVWPAIMIEGRRYIDGGFYSIENADLAAGCERVLVLTFPARVPPLCVVSLDAGLQTLHDQNARVAVVQPDAASQAAFASVGGNLLDPSVREQAARAGREQGRAAARSPVGAFWRSQDETTPS